MVRNTQKLRTLVARADEGLEAAFEGALGVLKDPKAQPSARASASSSMIKIYEMLTKDDASDKEPSEMTFDELQASIAALQRRQEDLGDEGDGENVFG